MFDKIEVKIHLYVLNLFTTLYVIGKIFERY